MEAGETDHHHRAVDAEVLRRAGGPGVAVLRRGLTLSNGDFTPFFTRPVCAVLAGITVFTMLMYVPAFNGAVRAGMARAKALVFGRAAA